MAKMTRAEQAAEILRRASESGVQENFLFETAFKRYLVQLDILDQLEQSMKDEGLLITKEYVKGRKNLCSSPAVTEYNRTTDSANKTVSTLMKIIRFFSEGGKDDEEGDPLMKIINGGDN